MGLSRRNLLVLGGLAGIAGAWQVWGVRPQMPEFVPIKTAPGWSFAMSGQISGGFDPMLLGLDQPQYEPFSAADLDAAVFRDTRRSAHVPLAYFSDPFCPFCKPLFARLVQRRRAGTPPITIAWHELPLLRPASHIIARAVEAARLQGGYVAFQEALIQSGPRPAPAALRQVAERAGLDGQRLTQDMAAPQVAQSLATTARAAAQLGLIATPALVIDRKVLLGAPSPEVLEALIRDTKPA